MYLSKHTLIDEFNGCDSGTGLAPHQPDHMMEVDGEGMGPNQAGETVIFMNKSTWLVLSASSHSVILITMVILS